MRLRNKKTGEVKEVEEVLLLKHIEGDGLWEDGKYTSLAELNEEWEDMKEPLIKNEKMREAIRTWAAAANVKTDKIRVSKGTFFTSFIGWIDGLVGGLEISFRTGDAFEAINDGAELTLTELCGEDEE